MMLLNTCVKMVLIQLVVLQMLLLLNVNVPKVAAQCPSVNRHVNDIFFEVLKNVESSGNVCKINISENKLGPYQISKTYYEDAVAFDQDLKRPGELYVYIPLSNIKHLSKRNTG